jgi:hypothetical protein
VGKADRFLTRFQQRRLVVKNRYEQVAESQKQAEEKVIQRAWILIKVVAVVVFVMSTLMDMYPQVYFQILLPWRLVFFTLQGLGFVPIVLILLRKLTLVPWLVLATSISYVVFRLQFAFSLRSIVDIWELLTYTTENSSLDGVYYNFLTWRFWIYLVCIFIVLIAQSQLRSPEKVVAKDLAKEKRRYLLR